MEEGGRKMSRGAKYRVLEIVLANYILISGNPSRLDCEGVSLATSYEETIALKTIRPYIHYMDTIAIIIIMSVVSKLLSWNL